MGNHEFCTECGESDFHRGTACNPEKKAAYQALLGSKHMKIEDPGHMYRLNVLDAPRNTYDWLTFVKRTGDKFPGNTNAYAGTTTQEVMRALIERARYVDSQESHVVNTFVIDRLQECIYLLECRAAERHGRTLTLTTAERLKIESLPSCPKCGHIRPELHKECLA